MPKVKKNTAPVNTTAANVGYEAELWQMADALRGSMDAAEYADVPGFCKSAPLEEVCKHGHVLTPGRHVGAEVRENDGEPFEEKMRRLTATLREQQAEAACLAGRQAKLDAALRRGQVAANLPACRNFSEGRKELGYGL